jgi:tetratricopeptide (TPR) repeat protein
MEYGKINQKLHVILFGLISCFLLLEIWLYFSGRLYYSYRIKNNFVQSDKINLTRILCIGDSFTFGVGASKGFSYPEQLQKILDKNSSQHFVIYNAGVPGTNSSQTLNKLPSYLDIYQPDIIIIQTGTSNRWILSGSNYFLFKEKGINAFMRRLDAFLSHLRSYKLFKGLAARTYNKIILEFFVPLDANKINFTKRGDNLIVGADSVILKKAEAHVASGQKHIESRAFSLAIPEFNKALDIIPTHEKAFLGIADAYACQGKRDLAEEILKKAIKTNPNSAAAYHALWHFYWQEGKNKLALETVREELNLDPGNDELKQILQFGLPTLDEKEIFDRVIEYDLENMFRLARARGIRVVLLNYPHADGNDEVREKLVNNWRVAFVDNKKYFSDLKSRKDYKHKDYFAEDEHCNNNGYRIIAQNIYRVLKP